MISTLRLSIIFTYLLCMQVLVHAQWREPRLTHLGPEEGITSWTFAITQDSTGYMYFGTDQGLVRYDGNTFELFAHIPNDTSSIGPGDVWCLYAGTDDEIWIGTRLSGLNVFNPKTRKFKNFPTPNKEKSDYDAVFSLYEDQNKNIWVGGQNYMLYKFDKYSGTYETYRPDWIKADAQGIVGAISEIIQDNLHPEILWLSITQHHPDYKGIDARGLVSFDINTKLFKPHACWGRPKYQDVEGALWLSSLGINRFQTKTNSCDHFVIIPEPNKSSNEYSIRDLIPYKNNFILSAPYMILSMSKNGSIHPIAKGKELGIVEDSYRDAQGNIWFGRTNGVSILSAQEELIKFYSLEKFGVTDRIYPGRLTYDPSSHSIFIVDNALNSTQRQIFKIALASGESSLFYTSTEYVKGIVVDEKSKLWIKSEHQLRTLDLQDSKKDEQHNEYPCIRDAPVFWNLSQSENGWIGGVGYSNFTWFSPNKKVCHSIDLNDLPLYSGDNYSAGFQGMYFTSHNTAILFSNEIFEVDLDSEVITRLKMNVAINPYPKIEVNSVIQDERDHFWVATLAMTGEFERRQDSLILIKKYTTKDGMGSAWVHELFPDQSGRVWAFAQNGINAIDPMTQEVRQFGVIEGLEDPYADPRQVLSLRDGSIATANGNGVIVFHPDSLWNGYTPLNIPIVLKEIRTSGKAIFFDNDVNTIQQLELKPNQDNIDVQFQGLAFPTDYNLTYSYMVEGLNEDWISIGENKIVTLSSLSPGNYTLKIKAGTPSSPAPVKSLHIYLATPLPQKPWFITLCILALVTLLYLSYRWRIRTIRQQEEKKLLVTRQMAELELKALRSQMNPHFMFNSLNSIKNYILQAKPKLAAEYLSNFSHLIRMILQNSGEKEISLEEELETLILYIELEQIRFEQKFEFNCIIEDGVQMEAVRIPPMILQPYIENAIWHGLMHKSETGHLLLCFSKEGNIISCMIDDDGIGRKKSAAYKSQNTTNYKSMGMGITKDRIDVLNKMNAFGITVDVEDKMDEFGNASGTRVIVKIPETNNELF